MNKLVCWSLNNVNKIDDKKTNKKNAANNFNIKLVPIISETFILF